LSAKRKIGKNDRKEEIYYRYIYVCVFHPQQKTREKTPQTPVPNLQSFFLSFFLFSSSLLLGIKKENKKKIKKNFDKGNNIIWCTM
jgi:hypothetical protein